MLKPVIILALLIVTIQGELFWTEWGRWGLCSVTCGKGTRHRKRECMFTAPGSKSNSSFIARGCSGPAEMYSPCQQLLCPVESDCACGCVLYGPRGRISTSLSYETSRMCQWHIKAGRDKGVTLNIRQFDVLTGYLHVSEGTKTLRSIVQPGEVPELPVNLVVSGNDVTVQFLFHGDLTQSKKASLVVTYTEHDLPQSNIAPFPTNPDEEVRAVTMNIPAIGGITACVVLIVVVVTIVTLRKITRDSANDQSETSTGLATGNAVQRRSSARRADSFLTSSTQSSSQGHSILYARGNL